VSEDPYFRLEAIEVDSVKSSLLMVIVSVSLAAAKEEPAVIEAVIVQVPGRTKVTAPELALTVHVLKVELEKLVTPVPVSNPVPPVSEVVKVGAVAKTL
jgi:hypothetical protein